MKPYKLSYLRVRATKERKAEYVNNYKVQRGCADCGAKNPAVLTLDHINPEDKTRNGWGERMTIWRDLSWMDLYIELSKCDVVCANCHLIREHNNRSGDIYLRTSVPTITMSSAQRSYAAKKRKVKYVSDYKAEHGCADCKIKNSVVLTMDHRDPKEKTRNGIGIHKWNTNWRTLSWDNLYIELAKCDIVCANCHLIRERNRRNGGLDGT